MTNFEELIKLHKQMVESDMNLAVSYLKEKAITHDNDKVEPGYVRDVYVEHFPKLKQIPFGTKEYRAYELAHFKKAHALHTQNRHHFYNHLENADDTDLFDLLEAIIDIKQSQKQYADYDLKTIMKTFKDKEVLSLDLELLAYNTMKKLDELNENSKSD